MSAGIQHDTGRRSSRQYYRNDGTHRPQRASNQELIAVGIYRTWTNDSGCHMVRFVGGTSCHCAMAEALIDDLESFPAINDEP